MSVSPTRLVIGSVLSLAVLAVVLVDHLVSKQATLTPWVIYLLGLWGMLEYGKLVGHRMGRLNGALTLAAGILLMSLPLGVRTGFFSGGVIAFAPLVATLPALGLVLDRCRSGVLPDDLQALGASYLGLVIVALPMLMLILVSLGLGGVAFCGILVATCKCNDIGGYLAGSLWGKNKLAPGVSPGKTLEGSAAGMALGVLCAAVLGPLLDVFAPMEVSAVTWILFGVMVSLLTQLGDLTESLLKRAIGVKDSAALLPSFGGILDLIDSLIFAAPFGFAFQNALLW